MPVDLEKVRFIPHKIDWEGWPDALEWLGNESNMTGDEYLDQMLYDAVNLYSQLENIHGRIDDRVDELLEGEEDD